MDPNLLLKDELEYELECRGINLKANAAVLKKLLKELLVSEQSGDFTGEIKIPHNRAQNVDFELEICMAKLNALSNYISEIVGRPDKALFKRLISRLHHVENRLDLVRQSTEDQSKKRDELKQQCQLLLDKLLVQDDLDEEESLTADDKRVLHDTLGDLGDRIVKNLETNNDMAESSTERDVAKDLRSLDTERNRSVDFKNGNVEDKKESRGKLLRTSTVDEDLPRRKLVPIYQWGIRYSGSNLSINAFLERVSELKDARNATSYDLWRYAVDFFEGEALIWYRANKEYATNWEDLVVLLKKTFQKPFYQEELLAEINARTQGSEESVVIYIAVMQNMFNRLPVKISEQEKLSIILKNVQPYYQRAVCRDVFCSIPDLINVLRVIERTKINCDNFEKPRTFRNSLEPDLAYHADCFNVGVQEMVKVDEVSNAAGQVKRCWNCRERGHVFRECSVPKQRLFCYRCGRFGVTSKDCECSGNQQGRSTNPAN